MRMAASKAATTRSGVAVSRSHAHHRRCSAAPPRAPGLSSGLLATSLPAAPTAAASPTASRGSATGPGVAAPSPAACRLSKMAKSASQAFTSAAEGCQPARGGAHAARRVFARGSPSSKDVATARPRTCSASGCVIEAQQSSACHKSYRATLPRRFAAAALSRALHRSCSADRDGSSERDGVRDGAAARTCAYSLQRASRWAPSSAAAAFIYRWQRADARSASPRESSNMTWLNCKHHSPPLALPPPASAAARATPKRRSMLCVIIAGSASAPALDPVSLVQGSWIASGSDARRNAEAAAARLTLTSPKARNSIRESHRSARSGTGSAPATAGNGDRAWARRAIDALGSGSEALSSERSRADATHAAKSSSPAITSSSMSESEASSSAQCWRHEEPGQSAIVRIASACVLARPTTVRSSLARTCQRTSEFGTAAQAAAISARAACQSSNRSDARSSHNDSLCGCAAKARSMSSRPRRSAVD
mmetsp:Transcript_43335/g.140521  ORF Transcript_43335/g.140521 Transcript_43335/m.140521 type:complete len:481 (+) Transcript_43335:1222-2664(+)